MSYYLKKTKENKISLISYYTEEETKLIRELAKQEDLSISNYIRKRLIMENSELEVISKKMEEIANLPKEGPIERQKGELCSYEKRSNLTAPYVLKFSKQDRFDG